MLIWIQSNAIPLDTPKCSICMLGRKNKCRFGNRPTFVLSSRGFNGFHEDMSSCNFFSFISLLIYSLTINCIEVYCTLLTSSSEVKKNACITVAFKILIKYLLIS